MTVVHEQQGEDLARSSNDPDVLRRFAQACAEAGDLSRLSAEVAPHFEALSGPIAVRPLASALATALREAAHAQRHASPQAAVDLYLRAAKILAQATNDLTAAAETLAEAWAVLPDERIVLAAQSLVGGTDSVPRFTQVALSYVGGPTTQIAALRDLAATSLEARRLDEATSEFTRLDALAPDDVDVREGRATIARLRDAAAQRAEALTTELAAAPDDRTRARLWVERAAVARSVGQLDEAETAYRQALTLGHEPAWGPLEAVMRERGELAAFAALLATTLATAPPERAPGLRRQLYFILRDDLARPDEARDLLESPDALRPHEHLAARTAPLPDDPRTAALELEERANLAPDAATRLSLLEDAATRVSGLDRNLEARLWRKVKALNPRSHTALAFHRLYYAQHPDPRRAYANLLQLHGVTSDPAERRGIALELAALAHDELQRPDKTIDAWRLVEAGLPADATLPDLLPIWQELRKLYAETGRWHAYVALLDRWSEALGAAGNTAEQIELLFDIVEVYQDPARLPIPALVLQTYQRIVAHAPMHATALDRLAVELAERERWNELLTLLAHKVDHTDDPAELVSLFHQIADLYLDHIRSESQAIIVLERLLELTPDDLDIIHRLRDLYRRRHHSEHHEAALLRELDLTSAPAERAALFTELGALARNELLQPLAAITYYQHVLALVPDDPTALDALQALHAEQDDWHGVAAVLDQRLADAKTKTARMPLLLELGEVALTRLDDPERAERAFSAAAASSPTSEPARRCLQRIFVARRKWADLERLFTHGERPATESASARWRAYVDFLRSSAKDASANAADPTLVADIHMEMARVLEHELGERATAADHLEAALQVYDDGVALASNTLELLGESASSAKRILPLTTLATHAPAPRDRYNAWIALGAIHQAQHAPARALDAWCEALALGAALGTLDALPGLEAAAEATGRWEQAFAGIEAALALLHASAEALRLPLHRALGSIARTRLVQPEVATRHLRWVLELAPGDVSALADLEKIAFSNNNLKQLEEVYRARIDSATDDAQRLEALTALARLYDDVLLDTDRAITTYQAILRIDPGNVAVQDALLRGLDGTDAPHELATALEGLLLQTSDSARRDALTWRLAELSAGPLADPASAIDWCRELIEGASPEGNAHLAEAAALLEAYARDPLLARETLPARELAYRKLGRRRELAALLATRLPTVPPSPERAELLDELVLLAESALDDPEKAFQFLLQRFQLDPESPARWDELERLAARLAAWDDLATAWRQRLAATPALAPELRAQLRIRLATVAHRRLVELDEAITELVQARTETSDPATLLQVLEGLEVLYKKTADLESFVEVKRAAAGAVLSRALRRQKLIDAAEPLAGALGRPADALALLEPLWHEDPSDDTVVDTIITLTIRLGHLDEADDRYGLAIAAAPPARAARLRFKRALLRRDVLHQWELAIADLIDLVADPHVGREARQTLLDLCRAQESAAQRDLVLEVLRDHFQATHDTDGLLATLLVEAEFAADGPPRATILKAAAHACLPDLTLAATQPDRAHQAFELCAQALAEDPADPTLLPTLEHLAPTLHNWPELIDLLGLISESTLTISLPQARQLLRDQARLAADPEAGDDLPRAIAVLTHETALAEEAQAADLLESLARLDALHDAHHDLPARRGVLAKMAARAEDPTTRARHLETLADVALADGDPTAAFSALTDALACLAELPPDDAEGPRRRLLSALESVARTTHRLSEFIALSEEQAPLERDLPTRIAFLHHLADLAATEVRDLPRAIALNRTIIALAPDNDAALAHLVTLFDTTARWTDLIDTLAQQREHARASGATSDIRSLSLRMADLARDACRDPARALSFYADVLATSPADPDALTAVISLEASAPTVAAPARALLAQAHRTHGDRPALIAVLERIAAHDAPQVTLYAELATLLYDLPDRAWHHAATGYALAPADPDGQACRTHLFDFAEHSPDRMAAAANLIAVCITAASELPDPAARADQLTLDLRDIEARLSGLPPATLVPLWRALLTARPALGPILDAFEQWASTESDPTWLAEALTLRFDLAPTPTLALTLGRTLGRIPGRLGEAIDLLKGLLDSAPAELRADLFDTLNTLYLQAKRHSDRAALLAARRAEFGPEPHITLALAELRWRHLRDPAGAVDLLTELVDIPDFSTPAINLLEDIWGEGIDRARIFAALERAYLAVNDRPRLSALYSSTLQQEDPTLQVASLHKLAELQASDPSQPDAAYGTLLALIDRVDDPTPYLDPLEEHARRLGRWDEIADHLERLVASGHASPSIMARLGRIHEVERHDPERAAHFYGFAFEGDSTDHASRDALAGILERAERWDELVRHLLAAAERDDDHPDDNDDRAALRQRAATLLDQHLGRTDDALAALELIETHAAPDSLDYHRALESALKILERIHDYPALHALMRRWIAGTASAPVAAALKVRLGRSLIRFPDSAAEGLTELEEVWRDDPERPEIAPALRSMITACERAEAAAGGTIGGALSAAPGSSPIDPRYAEATADAARLLTEILGDTADAATRSAIARAQLRVLPEGQERQTTLTLLAHLALELDRPEHALAYLANALEHDLGVPAIERELEKIAEDHDYWDTLCALYERCSATQDVELGLHYTLKVASILNDHLDRPREAASWFERYLVAHPSSRDALVPLAHIYRASGDAADEARIVDAWIEVATDAAELLELRTRLGVLAMDALGDTARALAALEATLPDGAADADLVARLERLYARTERFAALANVYQAALSARNADNLPVHEPLPLLAKLSQVYETRLGDLDRAAECARTMLGLAPEHRFALAAQERLARALHDWDTVDAMLARKIALAPVADARARLLIERAEVASAHLQRPSDGLAYLVEADDLLGLGAGPDVLVTALEGALRGDAATRAQVALMLQRRYAARAEWGALANVLLVALAATSAPDARQAIASDLITTVQTHLLGAPQAWGLVTSAFSIASEFESIRKLAEEQAFAHATVPVLLSRGLSLLPRLTTPTVRSDVAYWLGHVALRAHLLPEAITAFERVLAEDSNHAAAYDQLRKLYRDTQDWAALKGLQAQRIALTPLADQPPLALQHLLDLSPRDGVPGTVQAITDLLAAHPGDARLTALLEQSTDDPAVATASTRALIAQAVAAGAFADARARATHCAESTSDPKLAAELWLQVAAWSEEPLGDAPAARDALFHAVQADPNASAAWDALDRLARAPAAPSEQSPSASHGDAQGQPTSPTHANTARPGRDPTASTPNTPENPPQPPSQLKRYAAALEAALPVASPATVEARAITLARLQQSELGLSDGITQARTTLNETLARFPEAEAVREALVTLELGEDDLPAAQAALARLTDDFDDDETAIRWWRLLRDRAEIAGESAVMIAADEAILQRRREDVEAAAHLATLYRAAARWQKLLEVLVLQVETAATSAEAARAWTAIAATRAEHLDDPTGALDAWQEVWALDPASVEATVALTARARVHHDWNEVARLWMSHAEASQDPETAARAWLEAGRVRAQHLDAGDGAEQALRHAVDRAQAAATRVAAWEELAALAVHRGRPGAQVEALQALAAVADPQRAAEAWAESAEISLDQLDDPARAGDAILEALALDPAQPKALIVEARLWQREGRRDEAATHLQTASQAATGRARAELLSALADLQVDAFSDIPAASASIEAALAADPTTPGLVEHARALLTRASAWPQLAALLDRAFHDAKNPSDRLDAALASAHLAAGALADPAALERWLGEARALAPDDSDVLTLQAEHLEAQGAPAEAAPLWERVATALVERGSSDRAVQRLYRLGLLYEEIGNKSAALTAYRRAHELDGTFIPNLIALGRALTEAQAWRDSLRVHQALLLKRDQIKDADTWLSIVERLALSSWEAHEPDRARTYLQRLLREAPHHPGALALKARFDARS